MPADVLFLSSHVRIHTGSPSTHDPPSCQPPAGALPGDLLQYWNQANSDSLTEGLPKPHSGVCLTLTVPGPGRLQLSVYHSLWLSWAREDYNLVFITDICFVTAQLSTEGKLYRAAFMSSWSERHSGIFPCRVTSNPWFIQVLLYWRSSPVTYK